MAIKQMVAQPATGDIEVITAPNGTEVVQGDITFPNLATAVQALVAALREDENAKLTMARIVDAIERQRLYTEMPGCESMKAFFPILLEQTAAVGWKSATSIKRYLAFYRLYIRALELKPTDAIMAVSHLHALYVLAHIDRKSGELQDPTGEGKLGPIQFEDVTRLVVHLVANTTVEQKSNGIPAEALIAALEMGGLGQQAQTYRELMGGEEVELPVGGWTLAHTQRIIEAVKGEQEEEEEEDDDEPVTRAWIGYVTADKTIFVTEIQFIKGDKVIESIAVDKAYSTTQFELVKGKDATKIDGVDGEQADDE